MMPFIMVAAGGAIGALCRYGAGLAASRWIGSAFPYGTLIVNVLGCLLMGLFAAIMMRQSGAAAPSQPLYLLIAVGVLGGFTTFSSFSLDALTLFQRGDSVLALLYVGASVMLSLGAVALGFRLAQGA